MPDTLAWSSSATFDEIYGPDYGGLNRRDVWSFSIPTFSDLGPNSTLVLQCAGRTTDLTGFIGSGPDEPNYAFNADVTVASVPLSYAARTTLIYETNSTGMAIGNKWSTSKANFFKYDFAAGATVDVWIRFTHQTQLQGVISVALLRDFTGLTSTYGFLGAQARLIYPTVDASPLVDPNMIDPAPSGLVYLYAADTYSATSARGNYGRKLARMGRPYERGGAGVACRDRRLCAPGRGTPRERLHHA